MYWFSGIYYSNIDLTALSTQRPNVDHGENDLHYLRPATSFVNSDTITIDSVERGSHSRVNCSCSSNESFFYATNYKSFHLMFFDVVCTLLEVSQCLCTASLVVGRGDRTRWTSGSGLTGVSLKTYMYKYQERFWMVVRTGEGNYVTLLLLFPV